jgi:hypothetical protein
MEREGCHDTAPSSSFPLALASPSPERTPNANNLLLVRKPPFRIGLVIIVVEGYPHDVDPDSRNL